MVECDYVRGEGNWEWVKERHWEGDYGVGARYLFVRVETLNIKSSSSSRQLTTRAFRY